MVYSHLILDAILPNLQPSQIDELRACNRQLRNKIDRIRTSLPRTRILGFWMLYSPDKFNFCVNSFREENKQVEAGRENLMKYLSCVRPTSMCVKFDGDLGIFDPEWVGTIEDVDVGGSVKGVDEFLKHIRCTKLSVYPEDPITPDSALLERMPYVENLSFYCTNLPPNFMELLSEKTKQGPGLSYFSCCSPDNEALDAQQLLYLLKNALFAKLRNTTRNQAMINIGRVTGSNRDFIEELKRLETVCDRKVIEQLGQLFVIRTPSADIELFIHFFER